jgi:hypothetical protein
MLSSHLLTDFPSGNLLTRILERKWRGVQMSPVQVLLENDASAVKMKFAAIVAWLTVTWRLRQMPVVERLPF